MSAAVPGAGIRQVGVPSEPMCQTRRMGGDVEFIGEFRVVRRLGSGGMGDVFLVEHPRLPRQEALKLLDLTVSRNQEFRRRFTREADLLAPLRHPNIVIVHDRGEIDSRLWLTMEYVSGGDAAELVKERGALPLELVAEMVAATGAALDYAYSGFGITHRDVKPGNILLEWGPDDRLSSVKLADFGIAKAASEATSLTSTGMTVGTMAYISPEAIEGRTLDNRTDLYSLACTAFQLLTGSPPFQNESLAALMGAHLTQPPPSVVERKPDLPKYLDKVFRQALAKDPNARYQNGEAFATALKTTPTSLPLPDTQPRVETEPAGTATMPKSLAYNTTKPRAESAAVRSPQASAPEPSRIARPLIPRPRKLYVACMAIVLALAVGIAVYAYKKFNGLFQIPSIPAMSFDGLNVPGAVAVDSIGTVYVSDNMNNRVLRLSAGATRQEVLQFTGLIHPYAVAVDRNGAVYVADRPGGLDNDTRVMKLSAGASAQQVLPITGVRMGKGLAADPAGNVYIADQMDGRVVKLPVDADQQQVLPFTGLANVSAVAVDTAGNVLVADSPVYNNTSRILILGAGETTQRTLPFSDLGGIEGLAVDAIGNVYFTSFPSDSLVKLTAQSNSRQEFGLAGCDQPGGVAVGRDATAYIACVQSNRVVSLKVDQASPFSFR